MTAIFFLFTVLWQKQLFKKDFKIQDYSFVWIRMVFQHFSHKNLNFFDDLFLNPIGGSPSGPSPQGFFHQKGKAHWSLMIKNTSCEHNSRRVQIFEKMACFKKNPEIFLGRGRLRA